MRDETHKQGRYPDVLPNFRVTPEFKVALRLGRKREKENQSEFIRVAVIQRLQRIAESHEDVATALQPVLLQMEEA